MRTPGAGCGVGEGEVVPYVGGALRRYFVSTVTDYFVIIVDCRRSFFTKKKRKTILFTKPRLLQKAICSGTGYSPQRDEAVT